MQFIADENIPNKTLEILKSNRIDIISIKDIAIGLKDEEILRIANEKDRVLITFDKDFGFLIYNVKLESVGVILLRIAPKNPEIIAQKVIQLLSKKEITLTKHFTVLEEDRIRIKKL